MWASLHRHPTSPAAAASLLDRPDKPGGRTLSQLKSRDELTPEELAERQARSLIRANAAAPVKAAAALNVVSDDSTAVANPEESAEIRQS
jgi:hypothetical protein